MITRTWLRFATFGLAACTNASPSADGAPPRSRVNAVGAAAEKPAAMGEFCDLYKDASAAPTMAWPPLARGAAPPAGRIRWINIWATWCKPCVHELPRLVKWHAHNRKTLDFDLVFVSADGDEAAVREFATAHPAVENTFLLADALALRPWLQKLGLVGEPVLPVHMFVDAADRVRCIRSAELKDADLAEVGQLLDGL